MKEGHIGSKSKDKPVSSTDRCQPFIMIVPPVWVVHYRGHKHPPQGAYNPRYCKAHQYIYFFVRFSIPPFMLQ